MGDLGWKPEAGDGFMKITRIWECGDGVGYIYFAFTL